jgi:hypothetical protein
MQAVDILPDVLDVMRISGACLCHCEFSSPWCVGTPPEHEMLRLLMPGSKHLTLFYIVAQGECWDERSTSTPATSSRSVWPYPRFERRVARC